MTEIFNNINDEVRNTAESAWNLAIMQADGVKAAQFLDTIIRYYENIYTEEEIEFLQFYFNMKLEMMKE